MKDHQRTPQSGVLGRLTNRRPLFSMIIGTGAAWAVGGSSEIADEQESVSLPAADVESPVPVNLVAKIAGEDFANDWIKVVSEPDMMTTQTHVKLPIEAGATIPSDDIDSSRFRSYSAMAVGPAGPISLRLEVSPDDGATWFWHPRGESIADHYPMQSGELVAPLCRLLVTNRHVANQEVGAWLVLAR